MTASVVLLSAFCSHAMSSALKPNVSPVIAWATPFLPAKVDALVPGIPGFVGGKHTPSLLLLLGGVSTLAEAHPSVKPKSCIEHEPVEHEQQ
jgi:hypothetical protein